MIELAILIAQEFIPAKAWEVAAQSGFNAILVLVLLLILYLWRKDDNAYRERMLRRIELLTRSNTDIVLSMAFLPRQFHDTAKGINRELEEKDTP